MLESKYEWRYKDTETFEYNENINLPEEIQLILHERGVRTEDEINNFLSPQKENFYDPFLLNDMDKAVERIFLAKGNNEKVFVYGDYDVDGITSTTIVYNYLTELGMDVGYYIPNRMEEGYGVNKDALQKLHDEKVDLVVTVDTGIVAFEEVKFANALGMDMIVTDHHETQGGLPEAVAVINPKREDSKYPFDKLAGVGVAFKLIHAISIKLNNTDKIWEYLDIVSIGTIADIVSLVDENRIIAKYGFEQIRKTNNIGLKALLDVVNYASTNITSGFIGFIIGPRLNAAGRIADAKKCVELFTTKDEERAKVIANELEKNNEERQKIERRIYNEVDEYIEKNIDISKEKIIVVASENWHHGVIGIVASKIVEKYYRPVILLNIEDGIMSGSSRSISDFSIFDAIDSAKELLMKFGGHEMAAGLSLDASKYTEFKNRVLKYANENIDEKILKPKIKIDIKIQEEKVDVGFIEMLERLEPFGMGNPEPVIEYEGEVVDYKQIGKEKKHFKLQIKEKYDIVNMIMFNNTELSTNLYRNMKVRVVGNLQKNEWNNIVTPQILLKDLRLSEKFEDDLASEMLKYNDLKEKSIDNNERKKYEITREDFSVIYRNFLNEEKVNNNLLSINKMVFRLFNEHGIGLYKILVAMDVFNELGIGCFKKINNNIKFELDKTKKVSLSDSKILREINGA